MYMACVANHMGVFKSGCRDDVLQRLYVAGHSTEAEHTLIMNLTDFPNGLSTDVTQAGV